MFKRDHHLRIASVLQSLDSTYLTANQCYFGGGTSIALIRNEFRESVDIAFLVSNRQGYQSLRHKLTGPQGINAITRQGMTLSVSREIRADQYGIRTFLRIADVDIKFEIVSEGRIELEQPTKNDFICGIARLTDLDLATTKFMANSDRWADRSVFSRDLIDLAMLDLPEALVQQALRKAHVAYGDSIHRDLTKAILFLKSNKGRLEECMEALKMTEVPLALL